MASKSVLLLLACFLLINTKVSSDEILPEGTTLAPAGLPVYKKSPPPSPVVKATPPPPPPSTKAPTPSPVKPSPPAAAPRPPRNRQECIAPCDVRCQKHSRKNICTRACLACCERCKCVPPGQYGNREMCGKCYAAMTTRYGKLKCP